MEDNENKDLEKKIFDEHYKKQSKLAKKVFLITFGVIGIIFFVLGLLLYLCNIEKEIGITYIILGVIIAVLGVIMYFVIPHRYNYDKFKERTDKYGQLNAYQMNAKIIELEQKVEELESKIKRLENKK